MDTTPRTPEALAVTVPEACRMLGIGRTMLYELPDAPPSFTIGKRRLYPVDGLRQWIAARVEATTAARR